MATRTEVEKRTKRYKTLIAVLEDIEDIRAADEARAEGGAIPLEQVQDQLRAEGKLR
jgi:hypothetical protein